MISLKTFPNNSKSAQCFLQCIIYGVYQQAYGIHTSNPNPRKEETGKSYFQDSLVYTDSSSPARVTQKARVSNNHIFFYFAD
jgi:DNA replication protein DnaC